MKMVDKIEMSLDDIIKQTKGSRVRGGGGGRRGRGAGGSPRRGARRSQRPGSGVMRGRNRGGIARSTLPYTRVSKIRLNPSSDDYPASPKLVFFLSYVCVVCATTA